MDKVTDDEAALIIPKDAAARVAIRRQRREGEGAFAVLCTRRVRCTHRRESRSERAATERINTAHTYNTAVTRTKERDRERESVRGGVLPGRCVGEKLLYEGGRPDRRPARFLAGE